MPIAIKHKSSSTAAAAPPADALVKREIAINTADGKLFIKLEDNSVVAFTHDSASPHQLLFDTGAPRNGLGFDSNFYLDTAAKELYFKSGGTWTLIATLSGGGGSASGLSVTQTAHGLAVKNAVRFDINSATYVKAQANSVTNAEVVGVVDDVTNADNFHIAFPGDVITATGFSAGSVYFLSSATAGLLSTSDAPDGAVSKPVLVALSATQAAVQNSRGIYKVAATAPEPMVYNEPVGVGSVDGNTTAFTLEFTPAANSLQLFVNGVLRREGVDYTLTGVTVVFGLAPIAASLILATYKKA